MNLHWDSSHLHLVLKCDLSPDTLSRLVHRLCLHLPKTQTQTSLHSDVVRQIWSHSSDTCQDTDCILIPSVNGVFFAILYAHITGNTATKWQNVAGCKTMLQRFVAHHTCHRFGRQFLASFRQLPLKMTCRPMLCCH